MKSYAKFVSEVLATVLAGVAAALAGNGVIDTSEWINVVVVGLGAVAVLGAGNLPAGLWAHTKTIVAGATAGAVFLQSAISDGVSPAEWVQLALAVAGAIGVFAVAGPVVERAVRPAGPHLPGVADHAA